MIYISACFSSLTVEQGEIIESEHLGCRQNVRAAEMNPSSLHLVQYSGIDSHFIENFKKLLGGVLKAHCIFIHVLPVSTNLQASSVLLNSSL